jgi:hypothetical protein
MKQSTFITLFIGIHLSFIFIQIYKHTQLVTLSFQRQKNERILVSLLETKTNLINKWHSCINRTEVKRIAQNDLNMKPIQLHTIKRLD